MPEYKLTYFDGKGRAEPIRFLFALADVKYEDYRFADSDWPGKLKAEMPFGQVPVLETEGTKLCQSTTIMRYLADKFGYSGNTPIERARVQMLTDCVEDMLKPYFDALDPYFESHEPTPAVKEKIAKDLKTFFEEKAPVFLGCFEKLLKENGGGDGFLVGDKLTYADLQLFHHIPFIDELSVNMTEDKRKLNLDAFPKIRGLLARVGAIPAIAQYIQTRPVTKF